MEASETASDGSKHCPICNAAIAETTADAASALGNSDGSEPNAARQIRCQRCQCILRLGADGEVMIRLSSTPLQRIISELQEWCTLDCQKTLLLDFEDMRLFDTMGLSHLMALQRFKQCQIILCNLTPEIEDVFRITKLHNVFDIRE